MKDLPDEVFDMMQRNYGDCRMCGFKLNPIFDISDCINSDCKQYIKEYRKLKPYWEAKQKVLQE